METHAMWILILGLTFGCAVSAFVYLELIHPNVELEIRLKRPTECLPKNTFKRLSSWEEFMRSEQERRESLEGTWVKSKSDGRPLINYSSKKSWLSRTPGKIKKT